MHILRQSELDGMPCPDTLIHGECLEAMKHIADGSIDLIVTSPPYADRRKSTYGGIQPDKYLEWFMPISAQLNRVLKPGGSFVLNIKENCVEGERSTYVLELILEMKKHGWLWTEEYIWHKTASYPGKWPNRFRDAWERCLHFTKERRFAMYQDSVRIPAGVWAKRLSSLSDLDKLRQKNMTESGFGMKRANWSGRTLAYPTNVLHFSPEAANQGHSAAFPVALPLWFIQLFTQKGDTVLDPFSGSGTTPVACIRTGRHFIGIEKDDVYFAASVERVKAALAQQAFTFDAPPSA